MSLERDEMVVMCITAKCGMMTSGVVSGFVAAGACLPHCYDSVHESESKLRMRSVTQSLSAIARLYYAFARLRGHITRLRDCVGALRNLEIA